MKIGTRILSILLVVLMILSVIPMTAINAEATLDSTGKCGDNVYWNYNNETGELVISGSGPMYNYRGYESPFYDSNIKSVIIEDKITSIGGEMFYECKEITSINIGKDIAVIADMAFDGCYAITNITVDKENLNFTSDEDGVLFNKDKTVLIQYPVGNMNEEYVVPDGVVTIGKYAFSNHNGALKKVTLSNSVETIEECAFASTYNLENIVMPFGLKKIGEMAFRACHSLIDIEIPNSVTTIGDWTFDYCDSLTSIIIPESVTSIGSNVFYECTALESVTINCNLTEISSGLFEFCSSLKRIIIPNTVTKIHKSAFSSCKNLYSVTIPKSTEEISAYAFSGCTNLAEIRYDGSREDWSNIKIYSGNEDLTSVEIHYISSNGNHYYKSEVTPPTCSKEGYTTYECHCGYTYVADKTSKLSHAETTPTIKKPATCIDDGEMSHVCTACGKEIWTSIIRASGHAYVHTVTKEATHLEDGIITSTCTCGDSYTRPVAKLESHTYKRDIIAPTCTSKGYTTYTCACGDNYIADYVDELKHTYISTTTTPATHLIEGKRTYICESCGDTYTETLAKTSEHTYVSKVTAPTCTAKGYTTYSCACGDNYKDDYVSATGHEYNGLICQRCGKTCSCNCHKTGFMGFIWKIQHFFYKLFRTNKTCACGVAHY